MSRPSLREDGIARVTADTISSTNQHYIVYHFLLRDISWASEKFASGQLLDIGCGNKPYASLFSKVEKYVGCDIVQSSEQLVDFLCPASSLCFEDRSFDTVFSTQVIEHVAEFDAMISETFRVLKPGGHAIYTAPFSWELHEEPYDFFRFSKHGLRVSFEKHGFQVVEIKANGGKWAACFQLWLNAIFSMRRFRTWRSRLVSLLFVKLRMITVFNKLAIWLDERYPDDIFTLNYIIIVRKPDDKGK